MDAALELEHFLAHSLRVGKQREIGGDRQKSERSSTEEVRVVRDAEAQLLAPMVGTRNC